MQKVYALAICLGLIFISMPANAQLFEPKPGKVNHYNQSFSIQIGLNGTLQNSSSFGLQFFPPDMSYSRELFDNDVVNISTATFYDNIGVLIKESNFSYRVGQRIDVGLELGKYTPYVTLGLGIIKNDHHHQTSPVYGTGFLTKISKGVMWVNEINFQNVYYQSSRYDIVNLSTGITWGF